VVFPTRLPRRGGSRAGQPGDNLAFEAAGMGCELREVLGLVRSKPEVIAEDGDEDTE
jgi:hypothetical protein